VQEAGIAHAMAAIIAAHSTVYGLPIMSVE